MTAAAVKQTLDEWKLTNHIRIVCTDTTASNTGKHSGACHLLEELMQRALLYMPCRHHILEVISGNVFDVSLGCSSGPEVQLFVRFKNCWSSFDVTQFETGYDDEETAFILSKHQDTVDDVVTFANSMLDKEHPRDDYREFVQLVLLFLSKKPHNNFQLMQPGAHSRARWMTT